jgi:hypothetical protein
MALHALSMIRGLPLLLLLGLSGCDQSGGSGATSRSDTLKSPAVAERKSAPVEAAADIKPLQFSQDLTHDGRPELIQLEFPVSDIRKPFLWILSVRTPDGELILSDRHDDGDIDEIVSDQEHIGKCNSYEDCKRRYYFAVLPRIIGDCLKPSTTPLLGEDWMITRLDEAARIDLEGKSYTPEQVDAAISEMKVTLSKAGTAALCVPQGPDVVDPPRIWVESLRTFVAFYRQ